MDLAVNFLEKLHHYSIDVAPALAAGLLISGIILEIVPENLIAKYLSREGLKPILYTTFAGILLPVCCFASLPIAISLRKKGASLGSVLSFLVATPATSLTAILVTYSLLGAGFTLFLCASVIFTGISMGVIGSKIDLRGNRGGKDEEKSPEISKTCACSEKCHHAKIADGRKLRDKVKSVLFASGRIVRDIRKEILTGLVIAAFISSLDMVFKIIENYIYGYYAYLFSVPFGIIMYICSTASVPLVHAFLTQGLNPGVAFTILMLAPVTSYGALLVIMKKIGSKILSVHLAIIIFIAIIFGYLYGVYASLL